jgi:hypothetical protein
VSCTCLFAGSIFSSVFTIIERRGLEVKKSRC